VIAREPDPGPPGATAVVLLSGGLDSCTVLAMARAANREVDALSFDYGQRHAVELECAKRQARLLGTRAHEIVDLGELGRLVRTSTSLVAESDLTVPTGPIAEREQQTAIPSTYVPARNTLFLSWALAWAETREATEIWIGANAIDYSGYPDCRGEFLEAWERAAQLGTRAGVEGEGMTVVAPLLSLPKHEIIARGTALGVDYADTVSCYDADRDDQGPRACGACESCQLRRAGFARAATGDPTRYRP
jgi:7-cyano-7-deazaguanine synthase